MKHLKIPSLVATVVAVVAFAASNASATTLEVKGVKQTGAVTVEATIAAGNSAILKDTSVSRKTYAPR